MLFQTTVRFTHSLLVLFLTCAVIAIIHSAEIGVHAAASYKLNRDIPPIHLHTFIDEMYSTGRPCTAKRILIKPFHAQTSGVWGTQYSYHIPIWIFLLSISLSPFVAFATTRRVYVPDDRPSYLTEPEEPEANNMGPSNVPHNFASVTYQWMYNLARNILVTDV